MPAQPPAAGTAAKGTKGRKAGAPAKVWDYTDLDADLLSAPAEVGADLTSLAAPTRARDPRQVAVDKTVTELYTKYTDAGKPDRWATMPKSSYHVNPKAADTVRMMIRRAANFIGVSVRFGSAVRDQQGREIVVFAVRDMRAKTAKDKAAFSLEDLRAFVIEFFGDDSESAEEFLSALSGDGGSESDEESDEESEEESAE